jgi:CAAX prenyl protease-like protein
MRDPRKGPAPEDVAVAALLALPFAGYLAVLRALAPPSDANWLAADPILLLLPRGATIALAPALGVVVALVWTRLAKPGAEAMRAGVRDGIIGAGLVVSIALAVRVAAGPHLPAFVPPEESDAPGFLLSMTAGLEEEIVCRLVVLPALFFFLRARVNAPTTIALSLAATALFFAIWHALGEDAWSATFFATRFVVPGLAMSAVWLGSPSMIVTGHATAHLLIPALFAAPAG